MYADSLATGSHAPQRSSACMLHTHEQLQPSELAAEPAPEEQTADRSSSGRRGAVLQPCMTAQEPNRDTRHGSLGGARDTELSNTSDIDGSHHAVHMHSCLITGAEVQVPRRPGSGPRTTRATSSRRLQRGRSLTPPVALGSGATGDSSTGPRSRERRGSGRNGNHGKALWQGWRAAARECSSPHTEERSGSFDDIAAVHVPSISQTPSQDVGAVQSSSGVVQQQERRKGSGRASQKRSMHADPVQHHGTRVVAPACADAGQCTKELSCSGAYSGFHTEQDISAVMRSHVEMLNALPGPGQGLQSSQSLQSQSFDAGSVKNDVPPPSSGVLRESFTANQAVEVAGTGSKSSGPGAGPGALAPTAVGQMRPKKVGPARWGKRAGRQAGRGNRGPGQPAAPLMLANFEGAAQGEMRARLDTVRKLQEDTAAAEAKSGRSRRLRR